MVREQTSAATSGPPDDLSTRIADAIARLGLPETARRLRLAEGPTSRLALRLGVRCATRELAAQNVDALAAPEGR